jgi:preprotein translocase subunit YajC
MTAQPTSWSTLLLAQDSVTASGTPTPQNNAVGVPGATISPPPATGAPQPSQPQGMGLLFWLLPLMLLVIVGSQMMAGRKDKKRRQELMSSMKRGEKVQTIGGVIGTIVEVGEHEVVVRVEEGRIRFAKSAIQTILSAQDKPAPNGAIEAKPDAKAAV